MAQNNNSTPFRIVLTGGPGGGKTTAADLYRRELGERVVIVPEAATILFSGGFPKGSHHKPVIESAQTAIYHVQKNLEDVQSYLFPKRTLLCDRGTIDGAAYWYGSSHDFFDHLGTSLKAEFQRYHAVIFFESAAKGNISIEGGNPIRTESIQEALKLDEKLYKLWSQHSNFHFVPHQDSFVNKLMSGLQSIRKVSQELHSN